MDAVFLYLLAAIPFIVGGGLWLLKKEVNWIEWIGNSIVCFIIAGLMHLIGISGQIGDTETWSGEIVKAKHYAKWQEFYQDAVYKTVHYTTTTGSGKNRRTVHKTKRVFSHWKNCTRWHNDQYVLWSNIDTEYRVGPDKYNQITKDFKHEVAVKGDRTTGAHASKMIGGDPNDYESINKSGYIDPITKHVAFENRLKVQKNIFSFAEAPPELKLFEYPNNDNHFVSNRVIGLVPIDIKTWDQFNAKLGPTKFVNLIIINFEDKDAIYSQYQQAKWLGGKQNDLVLCYGGPSNKPDWVDVWGWTESEICKANIETLMLANGINKDLLPLIEKEVIANYVVKDFHKFDYIAIPLPLWSVYTFIGIMAIGQGAFWWWAHHNEFTKDSLNNKRSYSY